MVFIRIAVKVGEDYIVVDVVENMIETAICTVDFNPFS